MVIDPIHAGYKYVDEFSETWRVYGIGTYGILVGSWTLFCAGFEVLERSKTFNKLKCQPEEKTCGDIRWQGAKDSFTNWLWLMLVTPLSSPLIASAFPVSVDYPTPGIAIVMLFSSMLVFDIWFYLFHRALHEFPGAYKRYHKPHHLYRATFCWMSHAQHPVEVLLNGIGAIMGPIFWSTYLDGIHLHCFWVWLVLIQLFGVVDHCGFNIYFWVFLPSSLPFVTSVKEHDEHHRLLKVNFGAVLNIWDHLFGTHQ
mmetsp:Transcript_9410/g.15352  ORF Transcript_9410/g.15352 Transcript_9410/m.15352 type:complete len:255 (+) Transcript_9410:1255-2019(+)|eukprot:CAMPEP_0203760928 /NCGR_PEP_ID=MMETSP0098-20131031/14110_1 /ASSEMBLY_ACC=CAM_ASM_000208 /TAXON_ID=96639 /ORGANISM=" , Strain NY0313808BC1" /LENGTH=254 /DNA_ID=CAMNT_0050654695 /DNA_START=1136 /DNA_END=1900 /DNA_ORIENTATION=+